MLRLLLTLMLALELAGCATYGSEKHFERDASEAARATSSAGQAGRATVYFFRERALLQPLVYTPIPPVVFATNERLVSMMPVGSYVVLSLEPGQHKFSRLLVGGDWLFPLSIHRNDLELRLEAGKTYYVGSVNTFMGNPLRLVDGAAGEKLVASAELAKLIHNPATVDAYIARLRDEDTKRRASPTKPSGPNFVQTSMSSALPSSAQVTSFLEDLATVALAALLVAAVVAGGAGATAPPAVPPGVVPSPPAQIQSVHQQSALVSAPATWRTSAGTLAEIVHSKDAVTVRNLATGVTYNIEDGRIRGTDGSRYRVYGSTVFSDTGLTYQVIGNNLFTSDGRTCTKIGVVVSCR